MSETKRHPFVVGCVLIALVLAAILILWLNAVWKGLDTGAQQAYLGRRLNCEPNWEALDACFRGRFDKSMSQEQVYGILRQMDPGLAETLGNDRECVGDQCCEVILPFEKRVGRAFGYVLCFNSEGRFLSLSIAS